MRKTDFNYLSADKKTTIHATFWEPEQEPVANGGTGCDPVSADSGDIVAY